MDPVTASESASAPDRVPAGAAHVVADVLAGAGTFTTMPKSPAEAEAMMVEGNRSMVSGATARTAYLDAGFDEVEEEYGSFRAYLRDGLGIDNHALKELERDLLVG
ncbi:tyrosine-protein phosphatase [Streptomyces sp. NPDC020807]|uniref:tyrosine-protein phosphatase n=1 Tax=Streptomyces sp. NPDC020807 TaxID=3155119 RepID=UPI0034071EB9